MSEIRSDLIHRGFWVDWSKGRILGATLTIESTSGNVIIAFLAVLVSLAADHLWNLMLFVFHQSRAMRENGSAIFKQEQVIIRTLPTPFLLFTDIAKVAWAWRKENESRVAPRVLLIGLVTFIFGIAALVASVFSSYIVHFSDVQVLVSDVQCAVDINWTYSSNSSPDWITQIIRTSQTYVDNCYDNNTVEPSGCNIFVQPRIPLSQTNVSCPFSQSDLCVGTQPTSVILDSGLVDSNSILGINASPGDRIFFRKRTTYSPIQVQGRYKTLNQSQVSAVYRQRQILTGEQVFSFNYGQTDHTIVTPGTNSTTYWSTYLSNLLLSYAGWADVSYANYPDDTSFVVDPELFSSDADTAMIFVYSNNVVSTTPIDDPVFAAHLPLYCDEATLHNCSTTPDPNRPVILYSADHPAGVIAALSQYQACLADTSGQPAICTDITSMFHGRILELLPSANEAQRLVLTFLASLTYLYDLDFIQYVDNDASVLKASVNNMGGFQLGLPNDQWVTEVARWESILWAALQISTAYHTNAFGGQPVGYTAPQDKAGFNFCNSQKVLKPGGFANISVLGLSLLVSISVIIVAVDIFVLKFAVFANRSSRIFGMRVFRWSEDGVLQLQRHAHKIQGHGCWRDAFKEVPVLHLFPKARGETSPGLPEGAKVSTDGMWKGVDDDRDRGKSFSQVLTSKWSRGAPTADSVDSSLTFSNTLDEKTNDNNTTNVPDGIPPLWGYDPRTQLPQIWEI